MRIKLIAVILLICIMLLPIGCAPTSVSFEGEVGSGWTVGFGKAELIPEDMDTKTYYLAGYRLDNRVQGILDPQMVRALWLDDGTDRGGVILVSVDCVALARSDVERIRQSLSGFARETGCRAIHIMSTHTHAGVDTLGLWGPLGTSGRDEDFMKIVREGVCTAVQAAFADARCGDLLLGNTNIEGIQQDSRDPQVYDKTLTRLRFVPSDGSREVYMVHFSAHPEALRSGNSLISADYPCYMGQRIAELTGAEFIYFTGAIGGLISTRAQTGEDGEKLTDVESAIQTGFQLGDAACNIYEERCLPARLDIVTQEFSVPLENPVLMLYTFLGLIETRTEPGSGIYHLSVKTEISYMELGGQKFLLIPGELFPELAYGGALEMGATGASAENPPTFAELLGGEDFIVLGLANDEIGYIVPPNDFFLDEKSPYITRGKDIFGRNHYEETNSLGPQTADYLAKALERLLKDIQH